jgi:hypothetical protein
MLVEEIQSQAAIEMLKLMLTLTRARKKKEREIIIQLICYF